MPSFSFHLFFSLLILVSSQATALPVEFDFRSVEIEDLDGAPSLSINKNKLTIILKTDSGVLNRTNSAFGINATGSGDDTDEIDSGSSVVEMLRISFSETVNLLGLTVSKLGSNDSAKLLHGIESLLEFFSSGTHSLNGSLLLADEEIMLAHVSGNGFSFDSITVEAISVSEPSAYMLFLIGLSCFFSRRRLLNRIR